jgi:hypothetical protein
MHKVMNVSIVSQPSDALASVSSLANVAVAFLALVIAVISIFVSRAALRGQLHHNKLSVRPIPFIACADYTNCLRVKVTNNGVGPLVLKGISVSDGKTSKADLISWMPSLPPRLKWSNFTSAFSGRAFAPGEELILVELCGVETDADFTEFRHKCRRRLKNLTVTVEYTDVYGDTFDPCTRLLDWFDR